MSKAKLFGYDPITGAVETFHQEDGKNIIKRSEDVSDILRLNQIDRNHSQQKGHMRLAARIPRTVWEMWRNELKAEGRNPDPGSKENKAWLIARLNDPEWQKIRASYGTV